MEASRQQVILKLVWIKHGRRISETVSMMMEMDHCGNDILSTIPSWEFIDCSSNSYQFLSGSKKRSISLCHAPIIAIVLYTCYSSTHRWRITGAC